jgi:hypothetical protein
MTVSAEDLKKMRQELAIAEAKYVAERRERRDEVTKILSEKIVQIEEMVRECEKLAESADLVFYYSVGYEGFCHEKQENWSESSQYC